MKRWTPLLVTTGSEAGGEGTGAANGGGGGGGGVAPRLLSFVRGKNKVGYRFRWLCAKIGLTSHVLPLRSARLSHTNTSLKIKLVILVLRYYFIENSKNGSHELLRRNNIL